MFPSLSLTRTRRGTASACLLVAALLTAWTTGCGGGDIVERERAAIRGAIDHYLRERRSINLDAMRMDLVQLELDGDRARAQVVFRSEQIPDGLTFDYQLVRSDGAWKVAASSAQGGHGGADPAPMPDGHPPITADPPKDPPTEDS